MRTPKWQLSNKQFMTLEDDIKVHLQGYEERKRLAIEREKILDERFEMLSEKFDQAIIMVRDSTPPSLSENFQALHDKMDSLHTKVEPLIDIVDVAGKVKKGTLWISAFIIAIAGIISSVIHIKNTIK